LEFINIIIFHQLSDKRLMAKMDAAREAAVQHANAQAKSSFWGTKVNTFGAWVNKKLATIDVPISDITRLHWAVEVAILVSIGNRNKFPDIKYLAHQQLPGVPSLSVDRRGRP